MLLGRTGMSIPQWRDMFISSIPLNLINKPDQIQMCNKLLQQYVDIFGFTIVTPITVNNVQCVTFAVSLDR